MTVTQSTGAQVSNRDRSLTDADVAAIVALLKSELVEDFYGEVGRGVWSWIKRAIIGLLIILAVYGMANKGHPFSIIEQVPK